MAGHGLFKVPTVVLNDQARYVLDKLSSEAGAPHRERIRSCGFDPDDLLDRLRRAVDGSVRAETEQELAKTRVRLERAEDRRAAEAGWRWIRSLRLRLDLADARGLSGEPPLRGRFRFSPLPRPTVRGVMYELPILMECVDDFGEHLVQFGVDPAFLQRGRDLLADLKRERAETTQAITLRRRLTQSVRSHEAKLTALLREVRVIGQIVEIETGEPLIGTQLHLLRAHVGQWKKRPRPGDPSPPPDGTPDLADPDADPDP